MANLLPTSRQTTVHEALIYSAFLRLPGAVSRQVKDDFVEEIMSVVELTPLRNAIVGLPGEHQERVRCHLGADTEGYRVCCGLMNYVDPG